MSWRKGTHSRSLRILFRGLRSRRRTRTRCLILLMPAITIIRDRRSSGRSKLVCQICPICQMCLICRWAGCPPCLTCRACSECPVWQISLTTTVSHTHNASRVRKTVARPRPRLHPPRRVILRRVVTLRETTQIPPEVGSSQNHAGFLDLKTHEAELREFPITRGRSQGVTESVEAHLPEKGYSRCIYAYGAGDQNLDQQGFGKKWHTPVETRGEL